MNNESLQGHFAHAVTRAANSKKVEQLLKEGADPNVVLSYGFAGYITPVAHCIRYNKIEMLDILLKDPRTDLSNHKCFHEGAPHGIWFAVKFDDFVKRQATPEIVAMIQAARNKRKGLEQRQARELKSLRFKI